MTDLKKFKHKTKIKVRFMDIDAMQHVNNARYLNYLEESRIAYSQEVLGEFNDLQTFNAVVGRVEIDYIQTIKFGEKVEVYTRVAKIGTKSFQFESLIVKYDNKKNKLIAAKALQTLVNIDIKSGKSEAIDDEVRKKIDQFEN